MKNIIFLFTIILLVCGCSNMQRYEAAGRKLRMETVKVEKDPFYNVTIMKTNFGAAIKVFAFTNETIYEVPVYEKVYEIRAPGEHNPNNMEIEVIPNQYVKGPVKTRTAKRVNGVYKNTGFTINGQKFTSDSHGYILNIDKLVNNYFDDITKTDIELIFDHKTMGKVQLTISKKEFLEANNINMEKPLNSHNENIVLNIDAPGTVAAGQSINFKLTVTNKCKGPAGLIEARTFSNTSWLNGKSFIFGTLEQGASKTCIREFTVPADAAKGPCFLTIGMTDLLGAKPDRNKELIITVE